MNEARPAETAHRFGSAAALVAVLTEPPERDRSASRPALLMLNSGLIHRVAPQRLYVRLARHAAELGFTSMRFDFSGIGDSSVRVDGLPVEDSGVAETREAMDLVERLSGENRFVLAGLCGGGYFSFRTACEDPRVCGLVLLNVRGHLHDADPEVDRRLVERAMARHYRRIARAKTYRSKNLRKLLTGRFDARGAIASLWKRRRGGEEEPETGTMGKRLTALLERGVRVLNIYSEGDWSLDYVAVALGEDVAGQLSREGSSFTLLSGTNHVFTPRWSQDRVIEEIGSWLRVTDWAPSEAPNRIPGAPSLSPADGPTGGV